MKVTTDTPDLLILDDTPWLAGIGISVLTLVFTGIAIGSVLDGEFGGLIALVGTAMGALAFWAFVRRTMVIFDRSADTLEIRQRWVGGYRSDSYPLAALVRADIETKTSHKDGRTSRTHRLVLEMAPGHDPAKLLPTDVYSGGIAAEIASGMVNAWLQKG